MNVDGDAILLSRAANAILGMLRIMSPYFAFDAAHSRRHPAT
jgi:hypothetical protein